MLSWLQSLWTMDFQLLPIAFSLVLFELPAIIRRRKKLYYVPIYFSVFPFRELNARLSTYLGEDFLGKKRILSKEGAERIRKRIILMSVISMAIGALLTPLLVGFISAFYMPRHTFFQFVGILLVGKAVLLTKSVRSFHHHAIGTPRNRVFLILIYVTYLGVVFEVLRQTYAWTLSYVAQRQWLQLASDVSALVFGRAMAGVLLLGLLNAIFVSLITDRRLRRTNAGDK